MQSSNSIEGTTASDSGVSIRRPGLYVHVPFCSAICPYCDFAVVRTGHPQRGRFVARLQKEVEAVARTLSQDGNSSAGEHPWRVSGEFGTVYFGGGTPSALETAEFAQIQESLLEWLPIAKDAVWSVEANPEDVTQNKLRELRRLGFDYLSLGVQSFDAQTLAFLGRRHTVEEARRACAQSVDAGFSTVSIDLMYGMQCLNSEQWSQVLGEAAEFRGGHLSCYELTLHEGTAFWNQHKKGRLGLVDEEVRASLFHQTVSELADRDYAVYEVSNFALDESHRSPHNQKYWQSVPYLGIGPSAHSFDGLVRWSNKRSLGAWSEALDSGETPVSGVEVLTAEQRILEWLLTRLRTRDGANLAEYERLFGCRLESHKEAEIERLTSQGILTIDDGSLRPTVAGMLVADSIVVELS